MTRTSAVYASVRDVLSRNFAFTLFLAYAMIHISSVYYVSGTQYVLVPATYIASAAVIYLLSVIFIYRNRYPIGGDRTNVVSNIIPATTIIDAIVILFPIIYFIALRRLPIYDMLTSQNYYDASAIRHDFFDSQNNIAKYSSALFLHGLAPFWIIYSYITKRKLFYVSLASTLFMAFSVVTKFDIVELLLPVTLYCLFKRRIISAVGFGAVIVCLVLLSVILQSRTQLANWEAAPLQTNNSVQVVAPPASNPVPENAGQTATSTPLPVRIQHLWNLIYNPAQAVTARIFYVPGVVETQWLSAYPGRFAYEGGCGYRWYATLAHCQFVYIPTKLWLVNYPQLAAKGITGALSGSDYVNAYANFGPWGVVVAGICMGFVLVILRALFRDVALNAAFNTVPIILSFESVLSTLLYSGGWGLMLLLFFLFFPLRQPISAAAEQSA